LKKTVYTASISLLAGFSLVTSLANFYIPLFWERRMILKLGLLSAGTILLGALAYLAIIKFIWPVLSKLAKIQRRVYLLLIAGIVIAIQLFLPPAFPKLNNTLEIRTLLNPQGAAQLNPPSIMEIQDVNDNKVPLDALELNDGWKQYNGMLVPQIGKTASLTYQFIGKPGKQIHVLFFITGQSDPISVRVNGIETIENFPQKLDFSSDEFIGKFVIRANPMIGEHLKWIVLLLSVNFLALAFLLLLLSIWKAPFITTRAIQLMVWIKNNFLKNWIVYLVIAFGLAIRFLVSLRGSNYDFESFVIVARIVDSGQNVYANTQRYNYGPIWFNVLYFLYFVSGKNVEIFRYLLISILSLVDLGIFAILWRKINKAAACIFFLNPISMIITGYHNQFDNFAVFLGMLSVITIGDDLKGLLSRRKCLGLFILGISLVTKHIFFAFPFWLAVKQKGLFQKALVLLIPYSIFLLSFIPYWNEGKAGIIQNVLLYNSSNNEIFYKLFLPTSINSILPSKVAWVLLLGFFAVYFRKKDTFKNLLYYTCILVLTSPSITNHYLAIVVAFISVEFNPIFLLYSFVGTILLFTDRSALNWLKLWPFADISKSSYFMLLTFLLSIGLTWHLWGKRLVNISKSVLGKIKIQMGHI
jgi:hypothetical protein